MEYDLKEKVVLITGGAVGIGAKIIEYMLEEGVKHVGFLDIQEEKAVALQDNLNERFGKNKVKYHKCNVLEEEHVVAIMKKIKDEFGYIDILLNNAGIMNDTLALYKTEIQLNLTTLVTCTLKAIEWMRKDKGGKGGAVINFSSIVALMQTHWLPIYSGTKSAVLQFSNCIGKLEYYDRTGVRVIAVCFGATDTALLSRKLMATFDEEIDNTLEEAVQDFPIQKVESAGRAVIEICKRGASGSTWVAKNDEPAKDITDVVTNAYALLTKEAF